MKAFRVMLLSENEQIAIAITLSNMDTKIAAPEQRRDKTCIFKQGIMQEFLIMRMRLV